LLGFVFSLKTKGFLRILFNSLGGIILFFCLRLFKIVYLPLNPLNALTAGFLGVPGVIIVVIVNMFL
jgi:inhibitor of the pro-sigma K processing machinery